MEFSAACAQFERDIGIPAIVGLHVHVRKEQPHITFRSRQTINQGRAKKRYFFTPPASTSTFSFGLRFSPSKIALFSALHAWDPSTGTVFV